MNENKFLEPINNKDWVLKDGILVHRSTIRPTPVPDLGRDVITYITFEELFPSEKNSEQLIKDGFNRFWLKDIVQVLAKVHYAATPFYHKASLEENKIMVAFLEPEQLAIVSNPTEPRKIISRQQLLANLRLAFLYSPDDPEKLKVFGNEKEFGKLIHRITDFMEEIKGPEVEKLPKPEARKKLYLSFARNMVFNEALAFANSLTRYWYIFNHVAYIKRNRGFKLKARFKKATGTDFNYLTAVGFVIWGFYLEKERKKRLSEPHEFIFNKNYFRKTNKNSRQKLLMGLKNLAGNLDYFKAEFSGQKTGIGQHFSFNPFWRKPIFQTEKDAYYLLDTKYLEERLSSGAFWFIFDKASSDTERQNLKGKWGNIFEDYVNLLVKKSFPAKPKRVYSEIDGEETGGTDLIIYYPDTLFLIEITTKQVAYNQWIESNDAELEKSLKRILIKDNKSKGRVVKLQETIQKLKRGELKLEGVDMTKIKKFVPIILFEKSPPMHNRIWHLYSDLLEVNGVTDKSFLEDLEFWGVEELEFILADVLKGKSLPEIIKEKEDAGYYKDSTRNFYILHRKHFDKHPVIAEAFEKVSDQHKKILFKKIK